MRMDLKHLKANATGKITQRCGSEILPKVLASRPPDTLQDSSSEDICRSAHPAGDDKGLIDTARTSVDGSNSAVQQPDHSLPKTLGAPSAPRPAPKLS